MALDAVLVQMRLMMTAPVSMPLNAFWIRQDGLGAGQSISSCEVPEGG